VGGENYDGSVTHREWSPHEDGVDDMARVEERREGGKKGRLKTLKRCSKLFGFSQSLTPGKGPPQREGGRYLRDGSE